MPKISEASGLILLGVGIALLLVTFANAYLLLQGLVDIAVPDELAAAFGEALAPLITTAIRAIYLGVMGWVGSILTRRGVQIVTSPTIKAETKKVPVEEKGKPEEGRIEK